MTIFRRFLGLLTVPLLCFAGSPRLFVTERALIDAIAAAAKSPASSALALQTLERIAEGRPDSVDERAAAVLRLDRKLISESKALTSPSVRAYALQNIGQSGLDDSLRYLKAITPGSLGPDRSGELYPAATIARYLAILSRTAGDQAQINLLETALSEETTVALWAADTLCNRGSLTSLPLVEGRLRDLYPSESGDQIRFCEARIRILRSNSDRTAALASVLKVGPAPDRTLLLWAASQLADVRSAAANQSLDRFAREIESLPESDPRNEDLFAVRGAILRLRQRAIQ